jgi:hypothetical protein
VLADCTGVFKASWDVDGTDEGKRGDGANSGDCHKASAGVVVAHQIQDFPMQLRELGAQLLSGGKQRRDDFAKIGRAVNKLANASFETADGGPRPAMMSTTPTL